MLIETGFPKARVGGGLLTAGVANGMTLVRALLAAGAGEGWLLVLGRVWKGDMKACFFWSRQGPLSTSSNWVGRPHFQEPPPRPSVSPPHPPGQHAALLTVHPVQVGGCRAAGTLGPHCRSPLSAKQGAALPFDSSIYLANKPGDGILGLVELFRAGEKSTGWGCGEVTGSDLGLSTWGCHI